MPGKLLVTMAASAAMVVVGLPMRSAQAQPVGAASSAPPVSNSMVLFNRLQNLRSEMQQMQGQIEVLQHQLEQLQSNSADRYQTLDSRVSELEKAQAAQGASRVGVAAKAGPAPAASAPAAKPMSAADKAAAHAAFAAAFKALRAGNYVDSAKQFRAFIDKYPQSQLVSNAYYWLGGSYYVTGNYKPALTAYTTLLQQYPTSEKAPDAQLRVAECQIGLKEYTAARTTLQAVLKAHPGTSLAKRAHDRLQDMPAPAATK